MVEVGIDVVEVLICIGGGGLFVGIFLVLEVKVLKMKVCICEFLGFDDVCILFEIGVIMVYNSLVKGFCDVIFMFVSGEMIFLIFYCFVG